MENVLCKRQLETRMRYKISKFVFLWLIALWVTSCQKDLGPAERPAGSPTGSEVRSAETDRCLVGIWEAETIKPLNDSPYTGGTGFRLTFKDDGTQIEDYSSMKPLQSESVSLVYQGSEDGIISIENGSARYTRKRSDVTAQPADKSSDAYHVQMGPGALGSNKHDNSYRCSETKLEFVKEDDEGKAFWLITLKRLP